MQKYILTLLSTLFFYAQEAPVVHINKVDSSYYLEQFYFNEGDEIPWGQFNYDSIMTNQMILAECVFAEIYRYEVKNKHNGNYWLHAWISFDDGIEKTTPFILKHYTMHSAFEVYLNGKRIVRNGKIGFSKDDEVSGYYSTVNEIPQEMIKPGRNLISLRVSNYTFPDKNVYGYLRIRSAEYEVHSAKHDFSELSVIMTILLFSALVSLIFFISLGKQTSHLFFTLFCFLQSFKLIAKYVFSASGVYLLEDVDFVYGITGWTTTLSYVSFLAFLIYEFNFKSKRNYLIPSIILPLLFYKLSISYDTYELNYFVLFLLSLAFIIKAIIDKIDKSAIYAIGIFAFMLCVYLGYEEMLSWGYFIGIILFITSMFTASTFQIVSTLKETHESRLRSSRLENQLLKKNIQPHFLMNSLVSLQQLVKEDQKKAMNMIDSLADEFHLFTKISENKLIPLSDELSLCNAHLKIMEYRKDATFTFEVSGLDGNEEIPPAIFHTLIENGISHGYGTKNEGLFQLTKTKTEKGVRYVLFNDGDIECEKESRSNGTGTKYVKARLTESYGDKWHLQSKALANGYEVQIEIWS